MATLVRFLREPNSPDQGVLAYFPQINWTGRMTREANKTKRSYAHMGQHSACSVDYAKSLEEITDERECIDLINELKGIGYDLKILNKFV
jgi:hypothetical protein